MYVHFREHLVIRKYQHISELYSYVDLEFAKNSHLNCTGHSANFDDVKILSTCSETYELMIHESLDSYIQAQTLSQCTRQLNSPQPSIILLFPFFVPLSVLFLLCTTLYPLILNLS